MPKVEVNRAPVLTLWAAVVAERLGFETDEALTLGKTLAGLNAQSKGRRLGIFEPGKEKSAKAREQPRDQEFFVDLLGRSVPVVNTPDGVRATAKGRPVEPGSVQRYLEGKFGEALPEVREAMHDLAGAYSVEELEDAAYDLYEKFRPKIPAGKQGWGAKGELDTDYLRSLRDREA